MRLFIGFFLIGLPLSSNVQADSIKAMAAEKAKKIKETIAEMRVKCPDLVSNAADCRKVNDYKTCLTDLKKRCSKEEEENKGSLTDKAKEAEDKVSNLFK